jgi:Tfp pilus assembly protein PilV
MPISLGHHPAPVPAPEPDPLEQPCTDRRSGPNRWPPSVRWLPHAAVHPPWRAAVARRQAMRSATPPPGPPGPDRTPRPGPPGGKGHAVRPPTTRPTLPRTPLMRRCSGPSERRDDRARVDLARRSAPGAAGAPAPAPFPSGTPGPPAGKVPASARSRAGSGPRRGEAGFGLLEVVIAFAVLLVVLVATAELTSSLLGQAATTRGQVTATDLADQYLNALAEDPLSTLQSDVNHNVSLGSTTVGGERYSLTQYLGWEGTGAAPSLCTSGNPPEVMQATITVTWGQTQKVAETSVINPPYGAAQSTDGWLSIRVESAADPSLPPSDVTAVSVTVTPAGGGSGTTYVPDSQGCLYQPEASGSYSVTVSGPVSPTFVDNNERTAPPAVTATVTAGQATDVGFPFDEAATVTFAPQVPGPPLASGMPVTVANPGMTSGSQVVVPAGGNGAGPVALFPFPTGYTAWYGDCSTEQPASPATVAVSPGTPATGTVTGLEPLTLALSGNDMTAVGTATLADASCTTETYGLGSAQINGGSGTMSAQVIPEAYTVTVTDQGNNQSAHLSIAWDATKQEWAYSGTETPPSTPIPMAVP